MKPGSSGISRQRPDGTIATAHAPSDGHGDHRTEIFTYITKADGQTRPLYSGDRLWAKITLTLETAGPVAVGQQSKLAPILSGVGQLLTTNIPVAFSISKGTKLYIAATSVNRVKVTIEPYPWLEQIVGLIMNSFGRLMGGGK